MSEKARTILIIAMAVVISVIVGAVIVASQVSKQQDQYNRNVNCMTQADLRGEDPQLVCP